MGSELWTAAGLQTASLLMAGLTLAGGAGLILSEKLRHKLLPEEPDSFLKHKLPFLKMDTDQHTLICKNGALCRVIELRGLNPDSMTQDMLAALFHKRMHWLKALADEGLSIKLITVRDEWSQELDAAYAEPVLQTIHQQWMTTFSKTWQNRHYIILTEHPQRHDWTSQLKARISGDKLVTNALLGRLETATESIMDYLYDYQPVLLDNKNGSSPDCPSALLSFWATFIQGRRTTIGAFQDHLSDYLVGEDIHFNSDKKQIEWGSGNSRQVGVILSLNQWGDESRTSLMKQLTTIPGRFFMLQMLKGWNKQLALWHLGDQQKQRTLLADVLPQEKLIDEFTGATELIANDDATFFTYQWSMLLVAPDEDALSENVKAVQQIFKSHGYLAIQEGGCLEYAWSSFLPGSVRLNAKKTPSIETFLRPSHILSSNIASLLVFPSEPLGLAASDWGEGAIRLFKTASGGAYSLQMHETAEKEALAHSLVIAPAGSGKTTLFQHLIGGALRHQNLRAYIFDRFNGARIFTQGVGGNYIDLSSDVPVMLNPLLGADTLEERAFLIRFFGLLSGQGGLAAKEECRRAVHLLYGLQPAQRVLTPLVSQLFNRHGDVMPGLQPWVGRGERAHWFNGVKDGQAYDALSLEASRLVAFDVTAITEEGSPAEETAAVMSYLLHRIRRVIRREALPHMIFIDETAPMLKSDLFKRIVAVLLKEHRKLRGSISLCFQDMGDLVNSGMASVIIKQCPTQFLFPNATASRDEYALFNLTDAEWAYIKGETRLSRTLKHSVLVKKNPAGGRGESVILDIDMSPLGPWLKLYRSGSEPVRLVHQLQEQWGNQWIDTYLHAA